MGFKARKTSRSKNICRILEALERARDVRLLAFESKRALLDDDEALLLATGRVILAPTDDLAVAGCVDLEEIIQRAETASA